MKKVHKILIVVAVALVGAIAGTVVMSDMVGESNVVVQAMEEVGEPVAETQVVDETTSQSNRVESVAVDVNLPEFTKEEMDAMYPGYIEWFEAKQARTIDTTPRLPEFTKEELEAMYPGYIEWFEAKQARTIDTTPRLPEFTKEELAAMYQGPGLLEWLTESQEK